ncbi:hypothetical protein KGF54_000650 [Candida jiufengensis]|uniref:uncharacterized protein n=1 Tax=Candida jiufengensis TaxID=497108 RepID=UPI00222426B4|nr:uncharacterized protein KGF54_000650 [Candida jiufengensis]KAI5956175.1 hypothetical protein KGF54_000650 [Candida jiufengensis]
MMFKQFCHNLRFNYNYLIIRSKQRYYSLDNNPKVIRTKIPNHPFISLRTYQYYNQCTDFKLFLSGYYYEEDSIDMASSKLFDYMNSFTTTLPSTSAVAIVPAIDELLADESIVYKK